MATVNAYLNFNGNCEEAFLFYKSVFGGEFGYVGRFGDMPPEAGKVPDHEANGIMHISLPISSETTLMGSDTGGAWAKDFKQGNNISLSVNVETREEADRIFNGLSSRGKVTMAMADVFWGDYFGMCTDPFGINWMVSQNSQQQKK